VRAHYFSSYVRQLFSFLEPQRQTKHSDEAEYPSVGDAAVV